MIGFSSQANHQGILLREVINQRYTEAVRKQLNNNRLQFTERQIENVDEQQNILFEIQLSEQVISRQSQFYYKVLKKFFQVRKVINPQLTFQSFLAQYRNELNEKIQRYKLQDQVNTQSVSFSLNSGIIFTESVLLKSQTINMIRDKKEEFQQLQKHYEQVNRQYEKMVENLTQKNAELSVEIIQHQLRLKQHERAKRQIATKIYLPSQSIKNKVQSKQCKNFKSEQPQVSNQKKQEVQRIKVIVNNNMWGWGEKIHDRLKKLQSLQDQLHNS